MPRPLVMLSWGCACALACQRAPRVSTRLALHLDAGVASDANALRDAVARDRADVARLVIPTGDGAPCVTDEDCRGERCYNDNLVAQYSRVFRDCADAHAWRDAHRINTCIVSACRADDQCPAGRRCGTMPMMPFPQRMCLPAACRFDAHCRHGSVLGQCVPYLAGRSCEHGGWACVFPDDPCSPASPMRRCRPVDGVINYCIPVNGRFRCVPEGA